jgi:hypothetical protein
MSACKAAALRHLCLKLAGQRCRGQACEGPSTPAGNGRVTRDPARVLVCCHADSGPAAAPADPATTPPRFAAAIGRGNLRLCTRAKRHAFGASAPLSRQTGAALFRCAINAEKGVWITRRRAFACRSAIGTTLANTLLRHRASCLPYALLAGRETPRVRLDRTQLSRQIRHKKPDLPVIHLAGTSGFFYSWGEMQCTTTSAV